MRKYIIIAFMLPAVLLFGIANFSHARCQEAENVAVNPSTPSSDFIVFSSGLVIHKITTLMWIRCPIGQSFDGGVCTENVLPLTWEDALAYADNYEFMGFDDWRLPNIKELSSIVEERCLYGVNQEIFPGGIGGWSSTTFTNWVSNDGYEAFYLLGPRIEKTSKFGELGFMLVRDSY